MKANHNDGYSISLVNEVVVNISSSKNESKSQQRNVCGMGDSSCCKYQ